MIRIDKRRDPRAPLSLPIEVKTPKGAIKGKTANISISGLALLLFIKTPEIGDEFEITIKLSEDHEALVTCEKIWIEPMVSYETVYTVIGVKFIKISPADREIIAAMVEDYSVV